MSNDILENSPVKSAFAGSDVTGQNSASGSASPCTALAAFAGFGLQDRLPILFPCVPPSAPGRNTTTAENKQQQE